MAIGVALRSLGRAQRHLGAYADAERTFAAALRIFVDIVTYPDALAVILEQAELILHVGTAGGSPHVEVTVSSKQHASELLAFVVNHPAAWHSTRIRAEQLQADLNRRLPPPIRAAAYTRGRALAFAALVRPEADRSN
jgi:hypothetical protein